MKSYTDLEQSKILKDILPMESADMRYHTISKYNQYPCDEIVYTIYFGNPSSDDIPCWSLAALLKELPETMLGKDKDGYVVMVETMGSGLTAFASNPVDACYKMILDLHELKLL